MNPVTVEFELKEALDHLQDLVRDFAEGKIGERDEPVISLEIAHVLDHLCRAWNCKDMTLDEWSGGSQEEYERLAHTVPNFMGQRILGEYAFC